MTDTSNANTNPLILIVDDIPKNIQLLGTILRDCGYNVAFATSGADALKSAESNPPDLIMLDVMMPEMDGYEVCKKIKSYPATAHIPVIFVTGKTETDDLVRGFEMGGSDFISKPFKQAELLARVKTHIDLKIARDTLVAQNRELEDLNLTKDRFFSIISHDLRSPFQALLGLTEILNNEAEELTRDEILHFGKLIGTSSRKIYQLLENLLEWSMVERGKIKMLPLVLPIDKLIKDVVELFRLSAEQKNIHIQTDLEAGADAWADVNSVKSVVRNLVSNALKFSPDGGVLKISTRINEEEMVEVSVEDKGVGFPPEKLERFNKEAAIKSTPGTKNEKGSGLGLMLSREHVLGNNGSFWIKSEQNKGTTVYFTLPLAGAEQKMEYPEYIQ